MSFILDALRRAEAERARGHVPSLHSPELGPELAHAPSASAEPGAWQLRWLLVVLVALLATAGLAWWLGRQPAAEAPPPVALTQTPPAAPAGAAAVPAMPNLAPSAPSPAAEPAAEPATPVNAAPPPRVRAAPTPAQAAAPTTAPTPRPVPAAPEAVQPAPPSVVAAPKALPDDLQAQRSPTAAATAATAVPALTDLPVSWRAQLPPLALAGGMYSDQPAQRLVVLNGQVVHEGDQPAPGLRVEQIRPRAVVFSFQGQRFLVPM